MLILVCFFSLELSNHSIALFITCITCIWKSETLQNFDALRTENYTYYYELHQSHFTQLSAREQNVTLQQLDWARDGPNNSIKHAAKQLNIDKFSEWTKITKDQKVWFKISLIHPTQGNCQAFDDRHIRIYKGLLPPFINIRCFRFMKQMYLDKF
jgi:hypothetical protein